MAMKNPKDIMIGDRTLAEVLERHKHWLNQDCEGWEDMRAILNGASLNRASLDDASLDDASLDGASLDGASLDGASLDGASLYGAKNIPYIPMICPEEGTFIGWKKVMIQGGLFLAKLEIPEDAARSSATTRKCRASKAKVLGLYRLNGERLDDDVEAVSIYDNSLIYKAKTVVIPDSWDDNRWNECSKGIHFFMQRQEAINY